MKHENNELSEKLVDADLPKRRINRLNLREVEARIDEPAYKQNGKQPMEIASIW